MAKDTLSEYKEVINTCKEVFEKKTKDYGTSWRILRLSSITDQIYIKAKRIRSIQEQGHQKVEDSVSEEFIGIINYCIMALIQIEWQESSKLELTFDEIAPLYDQIAEKNLGLLTNKNQDYGEAWRDMRISSITDIILMKLLRVKQIEKNKGRTLASEGVGANYQDIINYAVFSLIKINEGEDPVNQ